MTKNRKMILALSILASGVSLFFSSPVLAKAIFVGQSCSVAKGSHLHQKCGDVDVSGVHMVTIIFDVYRASRSNLVCFGVNTAWYDFCTYSNRQHHLNLLNEAPDKVTHTLSVWAPKGKGGKVTITSITDNPL